MSICHFFTLISKEVRRIFIALYDSTVHQNVVVNKLNVVIYSCFSCELEAMGMLCGKCRLVCPRGINTRGVVMLIKRKLGDF